ncbi:hypothetical protein OSTOST_25536, partial [Ostertagia ostertagi]
DTTTVVVSVGDVNDNAPVFPTPSFTWNVTEGSVNLIGFYNPYISGTSGLTNSSLDVTATDSDTGANGELEYRIVHGNIGGYFTIDMTPDNRNRHAYERKSTKSIEQNISIYTKSKQPSQSNYAARSLIEFEGNPAGPMARATQA